MKWRVTWVKGPMNDLFLPPFQHYPICFNDKYTVYWYLRQVVSWCLLWRTSWRHCTKITESRDHPLCALVTSCLIAVRKPIMNEILLKTNVNEFKFHDFSRTGNNSLIFPEAAGNLLYLWLVHYRHTYLNSRLMSLFTYNSTITNDETTIFIPCGLKNPVIQKQLGLPSNTHLKNWSFLSSNSVNQNPMVELCQETLRHKAGTFASYMLSRASRRFCVTKQIFLSLYFTDTHLNDLVIIIWLPHLIHDDSTINGELKISEGVANNRDNSLHPVNLLTQENDQRLQKYPSFSGDLEPEIQRLFNERMLTVVFPI